jgi:hypothetical protein
VSRRQSNSHVRAGTIAHTLDDAKVIFRDKVKFPYDNLPEFIRSQVLADKDTANEMLFSNNSSIRVGTSLRSGTLQLLHISEFGRVCAKFPDKAREIRTGALNTIEAGQMIFIESTAEGQEGDFFRMCEEAQAKQRLGTRLTPLDFKFHFFPWWRNPSYAIDPDGVIIPPKLAEYFQLIESEVGTQLSADQRAWYVKKLESQDEDMKREYPATPKEAFEASVEGAYYGLQMAQAEAEGRICSLTHEPDLPVYTSWDIGMNDETAIWFFQRQKGSKQIRWIDYYENSGEGAQHYAGILKRKPYRYANHWLPHDVRVRDWGTGKGRFETLYDLGIRPYIVPDHAIPDRIQAVRLMLPFSIFDAERCHQGIKALKAYRKDWDEERGTWKDRPRHDWASNGADAFGYGALATQEVPADKPRKLRGRTIHEMTLDELWKLEEGDRRRVRI